MKTHQPFKPLSGNDDTKVIRRENNADDRVFDPRFALHKTSEDMVKFDIRLALGVVMRFKWLILITLVLGLSVGFLYTIRTTPLFMATASLEIQKEEGQVIEGTASPTPIADAEFMATQYELLKSRVLAERVVDALGLANDPNFTSQNVDRNARRRAAAEKIVGNIQILSERRSLLVRVRYISSDPAQAARIANALVDNFIESALERRFNSTAYARRFLTERLQQSKSALEKSERQLVEYAEAKGILDIPSGEDKSIPLEASTIVSLNEQVSDSESLTSKLQQNYFAAQKAVSTEKMNDNTDLRSLSNEIRTLNEEYRGLVKKLGPRHPEILRVTSQLEVLNGESVMIKEQIIAAEEAKYLSARAQENILKARLSSLKSELTQDRARRVDYTILRRSVDTERSQYEALLQRMKEISIAGGVGFSQISVVDRALTPRRPFEPNVLNNMLQAAALGLISGLGLAFFFNYIDDRVKTPDDIKERLQVPVIAVIPKSQNGETAIIDEFKNPTSGISEAYFSGRTALEFSSEYGTPKSIVVTSTEPGEGKSSTIVALAIAYAKIGKRVLIIDADMRKPSFVADSETSIGLSGVLTSREGIRDHIVASSIDGLDVLPSGVIPPNPSQIISTVRLNVVIEQAEELYDLVLVDSPPVLGFTDAVTLSSATRGTLIVMKSGANRLPSARRTLERLSTVQANILGIVLNQFDAKRAGYDSGYYYYAYGKGAYTYNNQDRKRNKADSKRKIRLFDENQTKPT